MAVAFCPDCGHRIKLGAGTREGQLIMCPNCDAELEVISLNPPELDWAYVEPEEEEEDWDYEDEEDEMDWDED
ncbi:MAG: lysine biosynthesis protein LysW [Anaerolineae bacterium]|nr:lysine biosynthesis protein LysW [Anaerolineae bacterium]